MTKEQIDMRDKCEEPIGTVDPRDSIEPVTTTEATLVRGGVKAGPDGRPCIPSGKVTLSDLLPAGGLVFAPPAWWPKPFD